MKSGRWSSTWRAARGRLDRLDHRLVRLVVGAELEGVQQRRQHTAVVRLVGAAHDVMELAPALEGVATTGAAHVDPVERQLVAAPSRRRA